MMWVRAAWKEGDTEEEGVIPSNWVQQKTVRWPNTLNVLKPLKEKRPPLENWYRFPLVKIKIQSGLCCIIFYVIILMINVCRPE